MWYQEIPTVDFGLGLYNVLGLFSSTLDSIFGLEALRFFLVLCVFLITVGLFTWLVREGRKGRL